MFQTAVLSSGSKGNSFLVRTDTTKILVDVGMSYKQIALACNSLALSPEKIQAVIISHEHSDHIKGLGVICRKLKIPVFVTEATYGAGKRHFCNISSDIIHFNQGEYLTIGDLIIHPFPSFHDAVDGSNFIVTQKDNPERKLSIATDLGFCSKMLIEKVKNSSTIILESNHDIPMLMEGPYPWELKQRVKSINGHLSNDQAIGLLSQIFHSGLENIILAHLSEKNNHPTIVERLFTEYLGSINAFNTKLIISYQNRATNLIDI